VQAATDPEHPNNGLVPPLYAAYNFEETGLGQKWKSCSLPIPKEENNFIEM
jgi:hypothetical protein